MRMKKIGIDEIDGFRLGNAEDQEAGTGVTVIIAEDGAVGGVDVRGGGPATRETDLLRSENTVESINAVVLSGGSAFGLEASSGVMRALAARNIGFRVGDIAVPIVCGASLFDLGIGRSDAFPDREMGIEAVANAYKGLFSGGNHGAGTGATVGKMMGMERSMKAGLGTYACGDSVVQVGAIAAVNACADIYNGAGNIIAGLRSADGRTIQGTIRVLKGMIHPESDTDLDLDEIRQMAAREQTVSGDARSDADDRSEIARAIMEAYEHGETPYDSAVNNSADEQGANTAEAYTEDAYTEDVSGSATVSSYDGSADHVQDSESSLSGSSAGSDDMAAGAVPAVSDAQISAPLAETTAAAATQAPAGTDMQHAYDPDPATGSSGVMYDLPEEEIADMGYDIPFNTTISCVITNAHLTKAQANKLASILHDAYARAIKPVHSTLDGDTVFVLATGMQEVNFDAFAALATDVLQYAIIDGALSAEGAYGLPAARDIIHK